MARFSLAVLFLLAPALRAADAPFDKKFWRQWNDGRAEVATYRLTFPRSGSPRQGRLVAVYAAGYFSEKRRVAAAAGKRPVEDTFRGMNLNLTREFSIGVSSSHRMTSVLIGLTDFGGFPAGSAAKVAFSLQEWPGPVYRQVVFRAGGAEETWHGFAEGEAGALVGHKGNFAAAEDALALWARGMAAPFMEGDQSRVETIFPALDQAGQDRAAPRWRRATYRRRPGAERIEVPAGNFTVEVCDVDVEKGRRWTFYVEQKPPHRIVKYTVSDGETAELVAANRRAPNP